MLKLAVVLVLLNLYDCGSTYFALTKLGGIEHNPLARHLFNTVGLKTMLGIKMFVILAMSTLFLWLDDPLGFYIAIGIYIIVSIWNTYKLRILSRYR